MKGVIIHALLAAFGLVFAYQTYTRKPEEETIPGGVTVAECSVEDVEKLTLDTANIEVTVEPTRDGDETVYWITTRHRAPDEVVALDPRRNPRKEPSEPSKQRAGAAGAAQPTASTEDGPDGAAGAASEAAQSGEKKAPPSEAHLPKRFVANGAFNGYLRRLTPVRALRSLGKLEGDADENFGFGKVLGFLELTCGGRSTELQSGDRAFGAGQRYLKDTKTGVVYLFDEPTVSDLESAQFKFMQADLHTFKAADVESITVKALGAKKKLLHRDRKLSKAQWVDEAEPAKRNEVFGNWFARLDKLRAREYLELGAEPGSDLAAPGSASEVLTIEYDVPDRPEGKLELVRVEENGVAHYYARSEATHAWVALFDSAAKDVEQDVGLVVGVEQAPRDDSQQKPVPSAAPPQPAQAPHGAPRSNEEFLPAGHPRIPAGH